MTYDQPRRYVLVIVFILAVLTGSALIQPHEISEEIPEQNTVYVKDATVTQEKIAGHILLESLKQGVSSCAAVEIAICESGIDHMAQNSGSTAKGVYQFIDSTWESYCLGDVHDYQANIDCFMDLYPDRPEWWECKFPH